MLYVVSVLLMAFLQYSYQMLTMHKVRTFVYCACVVKCTNLCVFDCDEDWHGDKISLDALEAGQGVLHVTACPPLGVS